MNGTTDATDSITLRISKDIEIAISPTKRGTLMKRVVEEFINKYMSQSEIFFLREDTHAISFSDEASLKDFRIPMEQSDRFPDIIIYERDSIVLGLIEVAGAKGPITLERKEELAEVLKDVMIPLLFFSAFSTREELEQSGQLAPGSGVWIAAEPDRVYRAVESEETGKKDKGQGPTV
jgi:hypothetical protein